MSNSTSPLVSLGIGMVVGVGALFLLLELWPILVVGGGVYLVLKGLTNQASAEEKTKCNTGQQAK